MPKYKLGESVNYLTSFRCSTTLANPSLRDLIKKVASFSDPLYALSPRRSTNFRRGLSADRGRLKIGPRVKHAGAAHIKLKVKGHTLATDK